MTRLLLVRHALNDYVKNRRLAGWIAGVHLSEEGRQQAREVGERLADVPLAAVFSSPLERAVETAEAIIAHHDLEIQISDDLGEVGYGEWAGRSLKELAKTDLSKRVQFHPGGVRFPGGEAIYEVQARVVSALERISAQFDERVVAVVAHADVIKLAVAYYVGLPLDLYQRLSVEPASLTVIQDGPLMPRLITLNDTAHLAGRPELPAPKDAAERESSSDA
jgi:probable phosphoglycerate mutase